VQHTRCAFIIWLIASCEIYTAIAFYIIIVNCETSIFFVNHFRFC